MRNRFCLFPSAQISGAIAGTYVGLMAGVAFSRTLSDPHSAASIIVPIASTVLGSLLGNYAGLGFGSALTLKTISDQLMENNKHQATEEDLEAGNSPRPS